MSQTTKRRKCPRLGCDAVRGGSLGPTQKSGQSTKERSRLTHSTRHLAKTRVCYLHSCPCTNANQIGPHQMATHQPVPRPRRTHRSHSKPNPPNTTSINVRGFTFQDQKATRCATASKTRLACSTAITTCQWKQGRVRVYLGHWWRRRETCRAWLHRRVRRWRRI